MIAATLLTLALVSASAPPSPAETPEQLAQGAIREILSAQAVHKQTFPQLGYACSLERLVEAQLLLDTWLAGKRVDGFVFKVWCEKPGTPQTTFRASGVPARKAPGSRLTVCSDESNLPRAIDGDVAACFDRGLPQK